uniref:Uncharacterized protein n=1 Tax=Panagrolaimus superbus TaxID=310955 RepID=A0A914YI44_9BILA
MSRYENQKGNECLNEIRKFAFYTENGPGGYEITSLSGTKIYDNSRSNNEEDTRTELFDKEFPFRSYHIAFPSTSDIVIEMEVNANKTKECFLDNEFQLSCLCYADNSESKSYKAWEGEKAFYYCGKQQSMICFDYLRGPAVMSSNPTILQNRKDFLKETKFFKNVSSTLITDIKGNDLPIKITFTIYKNATNQIYFTASNRESGSFEIEPFKEIEGFNDYDSMKLKIISVLPFQIFDPNCEIKWKFINGKLLDYANPNIQFPTSVDTKGEFISDKRTIFKRSKEDTINAATKTTNTIMTFIGLLLFYALIMFI